MAMSVLLAVFMLTLDPQTASTRRAAWQIIKRAKCPMISSPKIFTHTRTLQQDIITYCGHLSIPINHELEVRRDGYVH